MTAPRPSQPCLTALGVPGIGRVPTCVEFFMEMTVAIFNVGARDQISRPIRLRLHWRCSTLPLSCFPLRYLGHLSFHSCCHVPSARLWRVGFQWENARHWVRHLAVLVWCRTVADGSSDHRSCSATYDPARVPGFSGEADTATLNIPSPRCLTHVWEISKKTGYM